MKGVMNIVKTAQSNTVGLKPVVFGLAVGMALALGVGPLACDSQALIAQRGSATTTNGTSSLTINKPTGVGSGDVMLAVITKVGNTNALAAPSGWTVVTQAVLRTSSTLTYGSVMYRTADGSEGASFTFSTPSASNAVGDIVAFSGVDTTGGFLVGGAAGGPFDAPPGPMQVNTSGSTNVTTYAVTTRVANAAVVLLGMAGSNATWSAWRTTTPGNLTEIADHQVPTGWGGGSVGVAWTNKAAAGNTGTGYALLSASQRNGGLLIALRSYSNPANGSNSTISASTNSLPADGISSATVTVTLNDNGGAAVWGKSVALASDRGALDTITPAVATNDASGVATFTVKSTNPGAPVFTATDVSDSVVVTQTVSVTFTPLASVDTNVSTVVASPSSVAADNMTLSTVTVTLKANDGSPIAGKTVTLASSRGATDTISAASGASDASGVVTFSVRSSTAGAPAFTATDVTDGLVLAQQGVLTFTASMALRGAATGSSSTNLLTINVPAGVTQGDVMIMNVGQYASSGGGNPVCTGWTLLRSSAGGLAASSSRYGALMFRVAGASEPASYTFTLTNNVTGAAGAIVAFSGADPGSPFDSVSTSIVSASSASIVASNITTVTSNAMLLMFGMGASASVGAGTWGGWTTTNPVAALTEIYEFQNTNTGNSAATVAAAYKAMATPGDSGNGLATLSTSMRSGGLLVALKAQTPPADAANSRVTASPTSVWADGYAASTVTVTLLDGASAPVAGKAVSLASSRGAVDTISAASGLSDASGIVTFTVKSTAVGGAILTATDVSDGFAVIQTATVDFAALPPADPLLSSVSASPTNVPADGATLSTITVTLRDANTNAVGAKTVTLASDRGTNDTISAASGVSSASGVVTFTAKSILPGWATFTATVTNDAVVVAQTAGVFFVASTAKDILSFGPGAAITGTNILWGVASGTAVTNLAPTYTVSAFASGNPASGTFLDFTTPQVYTVTAQDGSTKDYLAKVVVSLPPQGYGISGDTDVSQEFSPMNRSGHPIVTGLSNYVNSLGARALSGTQMKAPWTNVGNQTMLCSDCHDSTTTNVTGAAQGPHGSAAPYMLRGPNNSVTNWPATTSFANSWCANCHNDTVSIDGGSHTTHRSNPGCYACHVVVPHGGKVSRLMATRTAGLPARYAYNYNTNMVYLSGFTKGSSASYSSASACGGATGSGCTSEHNTGNGSERW